MLSAARIASYSTKIAVSALRGFATRAENPQVFMDFSVGGKDVGRIVFEVGSLYSRYLTRSCVLTLFPRLQRISDVCALEKRGSGRWESPCITRAVLFTVSFLSLCARLDASVECEE